MVYQQAQFFCPRASFSHTTTLGTHYAFVLNVHEAGAKEGIEMELHTK